MRDVQPPRPLTLLPLLVCIACGGGSDRAEDARADSGADSEVDGTDASSDAEDASVDTPPDLVDEPAPDADSDADSGPDSDAAEDTEADTDDAGDVDADVRVPVTPTFGSLDPAASCVAEVDVCSLAVSATGVAASYRKDAYFPDEVYREYTDPPLDGGRFHIAAVAAASGRITEVRVDGLPVTVRLEPGEGGTPPTMEWYHVWPDPAVAGQPVWVAFHSRDPAWDAAASARLEVLAGEQVVVDGVFDVGITPGPLTWVTTDESGTERLIHLRNDSDATLVIEDVIVNGVRVLSGGAACVAERELGPGQTRLIRVPLCGDPEYGSAWTVVVEYADAAPAVGVGRTLRPHYVVEAWPRSSDCPVPIDAEDEPAGTVSFEEHQAAGFDTMYLYWGGGPPDCPSTTADVVNRLAARHDDAFVLIGDDFLPRIGDGPSPITDTSRVAGFLTGDESDGQIYGEDGRPRAEGKASKARRLWALHPELTVYNGGMTNGHVGTFAGMTDVQGMDVYLAACAPHITVYYPTVRQPFDYLRNTRDNHMPLPTWLYAQGVHSGWNWGSDPVYHVQPDPQEILVQAMYVAAAGGKGLMWFQTTRAEALHAPERWQAIADANWMIRGVRRLLYEGDPTGATRSEGETIVEAIRGPDAIVVPVINQSVVQHVDDPACLRAIFDPENPPHWIFGDQTVDVWVDVAADQGVVDVFELTLDGRIVDAAYSADADERTVRLHDVALSNALPIRLYVLAADDGIRAEVAERAAR